MRQVVGEEVALDPLVAGGPGGQAGERADLGADEQAGVPERGALGTSCIARVMTSANSGPAPEAPVRRSIGALSALPSQTATVRSRV
jgi:hypothetical protein